MSYAIEAKKRKFDRILESLTDGAASQPRTSLTSHNQVQPVLGSSSSTSSTSRNASDASKRRRITPTSIQSSGSSVSLSTHYLPSSRAAFLERLETFRHVSLWHIPSTGPVNASEWAKKGWICADTDTVACGSCKERITVNLDVDGHHLEKLRGVGDEGGALVEQDEDAADEMAVQVYDGLVRRYRQMITTGHGNSCPWRRRGCDASIQRIEGLLSTSSVMTSLQSRYDSIAGRIEGVPAVVALTEDENVRAAEEELGKSQLVVGGTLNIDAARLSACGWQRKDQDVIECRHCFRSLGLWLYRGEEPAMEHLDPVESHLEYCPWISADAQDTTVMLRPAPGSHGPGRDVKLPGWSLVILALGRLNAKRNGPSNLGAVDSEHEPTVVTPEQREKRMKDLMRRIREIKKPFNVKSLLRRKDQPVS